MARKLAMTDNLVCKASENIFPLMVLFESEDLNFFRRFELSKSITISSSSSSCQTDCGVSSFFMAEISTY
jgi:hypothetical protein